MHAVTRYFSVTGDEALLEWVKGLHLPMIEEDEAFWVPCLLGTLPSAGALGVVIIHIYAVLNSSSIPDTSDVVASHATLYVSGIIDILTNTLLKTILLLSSYIVSIIFILLYAFGLPNSALLKPSSTVYKQDVSDIDATVLSNTQTQLPVLLDAGAICWNILLLFVVLYVTVVVPCCAVYDFYQDYQEEQGGFFGRFRRAAKQVTSH